VLYVKIAATDLARLAEAEKERNRYRDALVHIHSLPAQAESIYEARERARAALDYEKEKA
jgi:hypothetical protein